MARAAWQYVSQPGESVWPMTTESGVDHPAPFPIELPKRLILIYTSPGDLVLDPFTGRRSHCGRRCSHRPAFRRLRYLRGILRFGAETSCGK